MMKHDIGSSETPEKCTRLEAKSGHVLERGMSGRHPWARMAKVTSSTCPRKRMPAKGNFGAIRLGSLEDQSKNPQMGMIKTRGSGTAGTMAKKRQGQIEFSEKCLSHIQDDANRLKTNSFSCCSHMPLMSYTDSEQRRQVLLLLPASTVRVACAVRWHVMFIERQRHSVLALLSLFARPLSDLLKRPLSLYRDKRSHLT